eukprot:3959540-Pyramimonas_sp.AAC.1
MATEADRPGTPPPSRPPTQKPKAPSPPPDWLAWSPYAAQLSADAWLRAVWQGRRAQPKAPRRARG